MFFDEIHVTFYADVAAAILSSGVFVLCSRGVIKDDFSSKVFRLLLVTCFWLSIIDAATYARKYHEFTGAYPLAITMQTLLELTVNFLIFLWLIYVNYEINHSVDSIKRQFLKFAFPMLVLMALDIINAFTGILFFYDEHIMYHTTWFMYVYYAVRYFYFFSCVIQISVHKSRSRDLKFFDVWGFLIPVLFGGLVTNLTPYSVMALGFAIGLCNVYAGIINELSFVDGGTGFFNRYYLRYLKSDIEREKFSPKSGMICRLEDPDGMKDFSSLLAPALPKKCEVVRFGEDTVLVLAEISQRGALKMISDDVSEAVEKYNTEHKEKPLTVSIDSVFKKKKESTKGFYDMFLRKIG